MGTCTLCRKRRKLFSVYLVVRESRRLSGWKGQICEECLGPWGNGVPMGGVAVLNQVDLPADASPPGGGG